MEWSIFIMFITIDGQKSTAGVFPPLALIAAGGGSYTEPGKLERGTDRALSTPKARKIIG